MMQSRLYPERRNNHAMRLTAHIMQMLEPYLARDANQGELARELNNLFFSAGIEVITEADRIEAGLPIRDHHGLTLEEIKIIDGRLLQSMLKNEPVMFKDIKNG